jgi:hypothetical protein
LKEIRSKWKEKASPGQKLSAPTAKEPSPDARYFSDRNIRVEKEKRLSKRSVPKKGGEETELVPSNPPGNPAPSKTAGRTLDSSGT